MRLISIAALILCLFSTPLPAQEKAGEGEEPDSPPSLDLDAITRRVAEAEGRREGEARPLGPPFDLESLPWLERDEATREQQQIALRAFFEYRTRGYEHRMRVFEWQLLSSRIIFVVVILLVLLGVYFSGIQFHAGLRARREAGAEAGAEPVTEFEASARGLKVSSSTLGVIILVISLAFFYLYLVFVFPIREIL